MKIALVSLNQMWENKEKNLGLCENYIQKASEKNVELIIFPEMTLTGFSSNIRLIAEEFKNSWTISNFSKLAKDFDIAIIFGVVVRIKNKTYNKSIFINEKGEIIEDYNKIHLFSFTKENEFLDSGNKLSIAMFKNIKFGLTICYDLRFPEIYSSLAKNCDVIVNIANWPSKRVEHWSTLLKARAIENQLFIIGVNRIGIDGNGLEYMESSNIFNANGEILSCKKIENMKIYDIDINWTKNFKLKFNTTNDRKVEFYKEIL